MKRRSAILGFVLIVAVGLIALPVLAGTATVDIHGCAYHPSSLTVEENTTVTWKNNDRVSHTATGTGGPFDSGPIEANETFNYTFADTGTYPYGCTLNASSQRVPMQGVVIVVPGGMMVAPDDEEPGNETLDYFISQNENLTYFARAVEISGLVQAILASGGPYTVFAPDDAAFEDLGDETLADLGNNTVALDTLLMYHIVEGNYTYEDLETEVNATGNETDLSTLSGDVLSINEINETLRIENVTITAQDIVADNGIIHVIDEVLIPPGSGIGEVSGNETVDLSGNETVNVSGNETSEVIET